LLRIVIKTKEEKKKFVCSLKQYGISDSGIFFLQNILYNVHPSCQRSKTIVDNIQRLGAIIHYGSQKFL
jgi:hypothetical protein